MAGSESITVEQALVQLKEMFPLHHGTTWRDFEIRARVYAGDRQPFEIVGFAIDGVGRRWRDYSWEGPTLTDCMEQVRKWREEQHG
jgi:hypothetical protein